MLIKIHIHLWLHHNKGGITMLISLLFCLSICLEALFNSKPYTVCKTLQNAWDTNQGDEMIFISPKNRNIFKKVYFCCGLLNVFHNPPADRNHNGARIYFERLEGVGGMSKASRGLEWHQHQIASYARLNSNQSGQGEINSSKIPNPSWLSQATPLCLQHYLFFWSMCF